LCPRCKFTSDEAAAAALVWWNLSLLLQFGSGMIPRKDRSTGARRRTISSWWCRPSAISIGRRYLSAQDPFFKQTAGDENLPDMRR